MPLCPAWENTLFVPRQVGRWRLPAITTCLPARDPTISPGVHSPHSFSVSLFSDLPLFRWVHAISFG